MTKHRHGDVQAVGSEQHRHAVERRRSPGSEIGGTATPRPAQRSRQPAWQASHPAFCGTGGGLYAYVSGMRTQGAPAPAETADCTHTAPAHPCESRITRAAEERLFRTCLDTASHPPPAHFLTARLPGRLPSSADDQVPFRYCLPNAVMAAVPKPHVARGFQTI